MGGFTKRRLHMRFPGFKQKVLTLSYDDGVVFDRRLIEIMQENGLKGTFNISSGLFDEKTYAPKSNRLSKEEAFELYADSGMEVAVHGYVHGFLNDMEPALATNEVLKDRIELENLFHRQIRGMAYAYGKYTDETLQILKNCGIKYARATGVTRNFGFPENWLVLQPTCHHNDEKLFELLDEFLAPEEERYISRIPRMFYLYGHSYEFNNDNNWELIEEFAKRAGNRDDVWYATNMEIYEYVKAFDSLEFSLDGKIVYNPSGLDVYLDYYGKNVIHAGETLDFTGKE